MSLKCLLLILLSGIIFVQRGNGARILGIFPLNSKSHFAMFEEMMKSLAEKGHQVDVVSHFPQKKLYPNYADLSLAGPVQVPAVNITYQFMQSISGASSKDFIDKTGTEVCDMLALPQLQKLILNPPNDPPYDLVIVELFYANCYLAFGRHLNVPVVAITSSPILPYANEPLGNPLNTAYVSEIEDGSISHMNFWQRLRNTIKTWKIYYESRYYTEIQDDVVKKYFGPEMPGIRQLEREISLLLVNSHHTLNGIRPMTPAVVEVGGLHLGVDDSQIEEELENWLDDSENGFIYVSFGSVVTIESFPEETLLEMYSAFSRIAPIRVLMRVAEPKHLPPGLPDNVLTSGWLPQVKVLMHPNIQAFVTHGGLMGIQEAVTFGVPLVGIPLFHDQPINVKNCADKEAALVLDYKNLTADNIVAAVNTVIQNPNYRANMMELSTRFLDRPMEARETAVFWVEYILRHGGDSLRSPAVKLTWWQVALLDVYGSILATCLIILYFIKLLLFKIFLRILYKGRKLPPSKKNN